MIWEVLLVAAVFAPVFWALHRRQPPTPNLADQMEEFRRRWNEVQVDVGKQLVPAMQKVAEQMRKLSVSSAEAGKGLERLRRILGSCVVCGAARVVQTESRDGVGVIVVSMYCPMCQPRLAEVRWPKW